MTSEHDLGAAALRITQENLVIDAHRDCYEQIHRIDAGEENPVLDHLVPRLRKGGVDLTVYAIGGDTVAHSHGWDKPLLATITNLDELMRMIDGQPEVATVVLTSSDVPEGPDGSARFLLHLEGGRPLEGKLSSLRSLFRLGVRSMQLTWNLRNEIGDGVMEERTVGGLTNFGVSVIREMNRLGMVVDLAHMSEPGFWQALEVAKGPVLVSHANSRVVFDHVRNLWDAQALAIAQTDGVIGVQVTPKFLGNGDATISNMVDHLLHYSDLVGVEHVGLGLDFSASDGTRPASEKLFKGTQRVLVGLNEADELPALTEVMLRRGFEVKDVIAILGGNFARVYRQILPV